ncbi:MAG: BLUF domain-containing protein [Thiomonas sp.]
MHEKQTVVLIDVFSRNKIQLACPTHDLRPRSHIQHDILGKSRRNNISIGVGGLLVMSDGYFFQALEGSRAVVHRTYGRILRDPRHSDSVILGCVEIGKRSFADWSMGYVVVTDAVR